MFIVVTLFISFFSEKVSDAEKKIDHLSFVVDLLQNVSRLIMREFSRERLSEGIANIIADSEGCASVNISLLDKTGKPEVTIARRNSKKTSNLPDVNSSQKTFCRGIIDRITTARFTCGEADSLKTKTFEYPLEYEGIVYGHIASVVPENCKNNYEFSFLLNSIADEFAYALYNLELASKQKKAEEEEEEEELRLDELRIKTVSEFSKITGLSHREMALYTLREAVRISKSSIGYIALIDDDNQSIVLMTLESDFFITEVKEKSYSIKDLSVITEIINRCRTQITEDEDKLGEIRNIYSAGNFILNRHIDIPVSASGRVAAVVGLGNMEIPYSESIIKNIETLLQGMWIIIQQRKTEDELALYRENLESMVKSRTEELEYANERLSMELLENNKLYKNLEESARELESFVHSVTHDLKSPLLSMKMCVDMLNKNYPCFRDYGCLELLSQIKKESNRMEELIKDVLTLSRVGIENDTRDEIDILKLIIDISRRFEHLFDDNSVDFVIRISPPEPIPLLIANRSQVIQVFENLLTNAVKYMGDGTDPSIVLCLESVENNFCNFYSQDTGIGIAEKDHEKIFQEFYRTHDIDAEGTGIGLAIVKKIIEKHGGKISLSSETGKGSICYFSLPLKNKIS